MRLYSNCGSKLTRTSKPGSAIPYDTCPNCSSGGDDDV